MYNLLKAEISQQYMCVLYMNQELYCCNALKQAVSKLEMSGREDCAVKILEEAVKKAIGANKPHEAYEIEMLLVEMLIYEVKNSQLFNIFYGQFYFCLCCLS